MNAHAELFLCKEKSRISFDPGSEPVQCLSDRYGSVLTDGDHIAFLNGFQKFFAE